MENKKEELFRKVFTVDRLPSKDGSYISCSKFGSTVSRNYFSKLNNFGHNDRHGDLIVTEGIVWWLEPINTI